MIFRGSAEHADTTIAGSEHHEPSHPLVSAHIPSLLPWRGGIVRAGNDPFGTRHGRGPADDVHPR
jgi:hypothetical protein